jgi:large subunit ribosomal protein L23
MGIFDRTKKKTATLSSTKKTKASDVAASSTVAKAVAAPSANDRSWKVLLAPRISEKAAVLASSKNTYVFDVPVTANKVEIRKAVERLYAVKVESVRTIRGIGKFVSRGRSRGQRPNWKKALVTLKEENKIDVYAGV